jgi:dipeptidyl aminopeptidase/acylaminoacyl peptidase
MHSRCLTALALTTIVLMAVPSAARAQAEGELPPLIPIQHFFDNPEIAGAQISPNGQFISYLKPYQEKLNVYVRQIGSSEERRMTTDTIRPVRGYFWSADGSMLLYVQDKGGNENFHVYSVPIEGNATPDAKDLTPHDGVRAVIFAVPPERPSEILIGLNMRDPSLFDAYWLDVETGETRLVAENPGNFVGVIPDHDLQVRLAMGQNAEGGTSFYTRSSDEDPEWREVVAYSASETVRPFRFHPDNRRVYMASNVGDTNLQRLVLLDLETGEVQEVESDPEGEVDFGSAIFSDLTDELIATVYVADTVRIYPKNEQVATDIARLRQVHDGTPNVSSTTTDETKWMVSFDAPTDPGATYLYDRETGEAEFLFRPRPWLEPDQLANVRPVSFPARDGLGVNGYLTLPRGVEPKSLPMVLLVHGSPWARDDWGYQPEAQMLANRGYAVLQVNYRGSTGYGKRFFNAAVKEFAGKMHDDLIDGVKWAVAEGIADPDLVGVYGGSYGGYATLVSLTFTPEVFACGVDYVGPSSLITLLFYVDQIEDPILIVQGANDPRVTKLESDQMVVALRDRGIKVSYLVAENEGHGFANADNRMALYRSMETFFGECLGGRVQDQVPDEIQTKIAELTVDVDGVSVVAEEQGR